MRRFEFQVYDDQMNLISRFPLNLTTNPSGLGFRQKVELVETKTIDYIVDRQLQKADIKLQAHFEEPDSYIKVNMFRAWCGRYIKSRMVLYYNDGASEKWVDCVIKDFGVSEINTGINTVPLTIQTLSPFYEIKRKGIVAAITVVGKTYPYSYPYAYGGGTMGDATLINTYFEPIPLNIRIFGKVVNPQVGLRNVSGETYTLVRFLDFILEEGQILEIDAINSRVLLYRSLNDTEPIDMYNYVDKSQDTFIFADPGESAVIANLDQNERASKIQISYVQYIV